MSVRELLHRKRRDILHLAESNGANTIRVFGSIARGEEHAKSDVDFLVIMGEGRSLFDLMHLEEALTELLQRKAQVVSESGLNPHFRESILQDTIPI